MWVGEVGGEAVLFCAASGGELGGEGGGFLFCRFDCGGV